VSDQTTTQTSNRYKLEFEDKTSRLMGVVETPNTADNDKQQPITLRSLKEHLETDGYQSYFYYSNSVELFLRKIQRFESGRYPLAEKREAKMSVSISHDKSTARVQTDKAYGGTELTEALILEKLDKAKIDHATIDKEKLALLTTADEPVDLIIANAIPPKHGTNATLEAALDSKVLSSRDTDSKTAIDQLDVFEFVVVDPGDAVMKKTPATVGTDGMDVQGKKIRANPGKDLQFSKPYEGVEPKEDDENTLIATIKGHPVYTTTGVKVDALMMIESVDIHSGHINYDGSLMVKHNIEAGFKVTVSGDIFVKGTITKAHVHAGGSINVSGGVNADDIDDEHNCYLEAEGDISAKYFHHTNVHCKGDIHAAEYLMQCRAVAQGSVNVGQERGRGCIIGGHTSSNSSINAKILGSEAYLNTVVTLGSDNELHKEATSLKHKLKRRQREEEQLANILKKIQDQEKPTNIGKVTLDKARKIENTVKLLQERVNAMKGRLGELEAQLIPTNELAVRITNRIFPNVLITILGQPWSCEETRRHCEIKLQGEKIVMDNLQD